MELFAGYAVSTVLTEIRAAVGDVRAAAREDRDAPRLGTADWLDERFRDISTRAQLRAEAKNALALWAGWGSFADVGSPGQGRAMRRLYAALRRGRSWRVRQG